MKKLLCNEFVIALFLLLVFLATSPYIYGWDDQHLEIPILKHLIDPSLYKGDYYVESASKYFTCWLYPILAKFITIKQIPATYFVLFVISRYVLFYFVYRLWLLISGSIFTALCTSLTFLYLGRVDEFLYRSFCHEEFTFMFIFAGLYYFYRDRYLLAAFLFGVGVNFHAIYGLFPMLYLLAFLLLFHPRRFTKIFQTGFIFVAASLPFLFWQIPISISREVAHPVPVSEWMPLYLLSCPQNFVFAEVPAHQVWSDVHTFWHSFGPYFLLILLYVFHWLFNPTFRQDKKMHAVMWLSAAILGVAYYFDYAHPSRFALDLNLIRVEQFMRFFMMGYTTVWACDQLQKQKPWLALVAAAVVLACGTTVLIKLFFICLAGMVSMLYGDSSPSTNFKKVFKIVFFLMFLVLACLLGKELRNSLDVHLSWLEFKYVIIAMGVVFLALLFKNKTSWLYKFLFIVLLTGAFSVCVWNSYHYIKLKNTGPGPWEMLRDWEDMQLYVRDHTPKDAMVLTPYDMVMGGFRIHSERKVVVCYRDCGIIGFDYPAAVEWNKRISDIRDFKVFANGPVNDAVLRAILKYKVDYVVFMKYYAPPGDSDILKKMYDNAVFSLFQVL